MNNKKPALVMKLKDSTMMVVTDEGDFWEVPLTKPVPLVGEKVLVSAPPASNLQEKMSESKASSWRQYLLPVAAVFMFLFIGSINWYLQQSGTSDPIGPIASQPVEQSGESASSSPHDLDAASEGKSPAEDSNLFAEGVSYMLAIDINPSLEINLDSDLNFVSATGLNTEAKALLTKAQLTPGQSLADVMSKIISLSKDHLYLTNDIDNLVLATLVQNELKDKGVSTESNALEHLEPEITLVDLVTEIEATIVLTLEEKEIPAQVGVRKGGVDEWEQAKSELVSLNKQYIKDLLAEHEIEVSDDELQNMNMTAVLASKKIPPGQLMRYLKQTSKYEELSKEEIKNILDQLKEEQKEQKREQRHTNPNAPERPQTAPPGQTGPPGEVKQPEQGGPKLPPGQQKKEIDRPDAPNSPNVESPQKPNQND